MYYLSAALMFMLMIGYMASGAIKSVSRSARLTKLYSERIDVQRKAASQQAHLQWKKMGALVEKPLEKPKAKGRYMPEQRLDILPIFSENNEVLLSLLEAFVLREELMTKELFKAWRQESKKLYALQKEHFDERALYALEFENKQMRTAYFKALKNGLFDLVKVGGTDGKIVVHQVSKELAAVLFDEKSMRLVLDYNARAKKDRKIPLWKNSDLEQLKVRDFKWRSLLTTVLQTAKDHPLFEKISSGEARLRRLNVE